MKLAHAVALLGIAPSSIAATAQIGIYATFDAQRRHESGIFAFPPQGSNNAANNWLYGPTFGVYDDFLHLGPLIAGGDLRGDFVHSGSYTRKAGLVGLRVAVKPPVIPIKPYVQASIGVAHTNGPGSPSPSNNLEYRVMGGLDFTVLPRIDWRVLEVGGGSLVNYNFGSGPNQSNNLFTFSTGFVFRLP